MNSTIFSISIFQRLCNYLLLLLVVTAFNLFAANPVLVGVDSNGQPLKYGSGWDKVNFVSQPVVSDDGTVTFIFPAPSPEDSSWIPALIGVNSASLLAATPKSEVVFPSYDEMGYLIGKMFGNTIDMYAWTNYRLLRGANALFFALRKNGRGNGAPTYEYTCSNDPSDFSSEFFNVDDRSPVAISGNGSLLAIADKDGEITLLDDTFTVVPDTGLPATDGQPFALSPDGSQIFFSSSDLSPEEEGTIIFAYDRVSQSLTQIANAILPDATGPNASPELSAAQSKTAIAFVTNNVALLNIASEKSEYIETHGTQIIVAQLENGFWRTEWCSGAQELFACASPALSGDGRFVVFTAKTTSSGISQIWRYDRALKVLEQVAEANAECMSPAISPNGRFVAFVTKATNLGYANSANNANVWAIDMGTSPIAEKPLHHISTAPSGKVFLNGKGGGFINGDSFAMDETGSLVAYNTTVKDDTQHYNTKVIYLWDLALGVITHLIKDAEEAENLLNIKLSGDGRHLFFTRNLSLYKYTITTSSFSITTDDVPEIAAGLDTGDYAVSFDGSTLAYLKSGVPYICVNGEERAVSEENSFSKAMMSHDGLTAAFLSGNTLALCDTSTGTMTALADNITACAAPHSLTRFLVLQDGSLKWLARDGSTEALSLNGLPGFTPNDFAISANGRFLAFRHRHNGIWQACRYDLLTNQETVASLADDGQYASSLVLASPHPTISADGSRICFASPAQNLLEGKANGITNELYLTAFAPAANTPAQFATTQLADDESPDDILFPLAYNDLEKNDTIPMNLVADASLHAELLPYGTWYAIKIRPESPYFCGNATLSLSLWDGTELSSPQTITLTVNNVNNPPAWSDTIPSQAITYTISEGEDKNGADYAPYVDDPDLQNPAPFNTEKLVFSLENAPNWVTINGSTLHFAPGYDVTTRGTIATSTFNIIATDSEGESVSLEVTVKVQNTNRPPQIIAAQQEIRENAWLQATDFTLLDDDPEDQALLKLRLAASNGSWFNKTGNKVTFPLALSEFPIRFQSTGNVYGSLTATATLYDGDNAASNSVTITILLDKVQVKLSSLWPSLVGSTQQNAQSNRWLMLASPYGLTTAKLATALGTDALWVWDGDSYSPAPETLAPGQGFAVQISSLRPDATLVGLRGDAIPLLPGWNLIGTSAAPQAGPFFMQLNNNYIKLNAPPSVSPMQNWAFWAFSY